MRCIVPAERKTFFTIVSLLIDPSLMEIDALSYKGTENGSYSKNIDDATAPKDVVDDESPGCTVVKEEVSPANDTNDDSSSTIADVHVNKGTVPGSAASDGELRQAVDVDSFSQFIPESKRAVVQKLQQLFSYDC
jgi:hypothetical protein